MTTNTEALRAPFEKLLSDSGRACLYEGDGQYAYPHDFAWLCYQAGHTAAKAETVDEVAKERGHCALVHAAAREIERLRDLCDDLYSDLLAAGSLVPRDCGAYALIQEAIKLRRDRWAHKE